MFFAVYPSHLESGSFQTEMNFLTQVDKAGFDRGASEQNFIFGLKWFKRVPMGPKGFQMVKNIMVDHFGTFWTTLEHWQACHVWFKMDHFWTLHSYERWAPK